LIRTARLDSRAQVILEPVRHTDVVSVGLWNVRGSRDESRGEAGFSHFLEHMLFKGTERRNAFQIAREVERVGGFLNAFTEKEVICSYCTLPADNLELAVDVLADMYLVNNREFLGRLEALGFYVGDESLANYSQTSLSLASSLNMSYLDGVAAELGVDNRDQRPLNRLIRHNMVRRALEDLGYEVYAFQTGYRKTEWEDADYFFAPATKAVSAFEALYIDVLGLTPITRWLASRGWLEETPGYAAHRNRIRFAFEQAAALYPSARPRLVFLHVILPHPPFVFGADGSAVWSMEPFEMKDGTEFSGTPAEYVAGYSAQLEFANQQALELVEQVLRSSTRPVVIVIQGDHGPGSQLDWDVPEQSNLRERMGILNAYYAPKAEAALYPSITPVNSFRVVFNHYLGYNLALLADRSYLSSWRAPYRFIEYREE